MSTAQEIKILVSPLNWGMGHATRCVPVIRELHKQGVKVGIACHETLKPIYLNEFKNIRFEKFPESTIHYSRFLPLWISLIFQLPKFILNIFLEHRELRRLLKEQHYDVVISDNRYGLWNKSVLSILITHQVKLKLPSALSWWPVYQITQKFNQKAIKNFDECWIPDNPAPRNLAGELSETVDSTLKISYLGILSRFHPLICRQKEQILVMISGPEPQRSFLFHKILHQSNAVSMPVHFVIQRSHKTLPEMSSNVYIHSDISAGVLNQLLVESRYIIARAGYSSIMELVCLQRKAVLIPTPGQTEQEYLAGYMEKYGFIRKNQTNFLLEQSISELVAEVKSIDLSLCDETLLLNRIKEITEKE